MTLDDVEEIAASLGSHDRPALRVWVGWLAKSKLDVLVGLQAKNLGLYRANLSEAGLSPHTIKRYIRVIREFVIIPGVEAGVVSSKALTERSARMSRVRKDKIDPSLRVRIDVTSRNHPVVKLINQTTGTIAAALLNVDVDELRSWTRDSAFPDDVTERASSLLDKHKGTIPRSVLMGDEFIPNIYYYATHQRGAGHSPPQNGSYIPAVTSRRSSAL